MNKKEIAGIRKEFKADSIMMKVKEIYSVYFKKDGQTVIHNELQYFESFDTEKKELYLNNFKKVLSGSIDTKLFELDFKDMESEDNTQRLLYTGLNASDKESLREQLDKIMEKLSANYKYDNDAMITFIRAEYFKGNKKRNAEADEAIDDSVQAFEFILCSVNKIEAPKKSLKFDYESREFVPNSTVEALINLNSPLEGFMFPAFENGFSNVNKLVYYSSKSKEINSLFIEEVLNCSTKLTAEDEKECFHAILNNVVGDKIKPEVMQEIYTKINDKANEEEENQSISVKDVKVILESSGISGVEELDKAFEEVCGTNYDFNVNNIVPNFNNKSIKISNETADITITPKDLNMIKQVKDKDGRKCLLIELNEDIVINGFKLETEEL